MTDAAFLYSKWLSKVEQVLTKSLFVVCGFCTCCGIVSSLWTFVGPVSEFVALETSILGCWSAGINCWRLFLDSLTWLGEGLFVWIIPVSCSGETLSKIWPMRTKTLPWKWLGFLARKCTCCSVVRLLVVTPFLDSENSLSKLWSVVSERVILIFLNNIPPILISNANNLVSFVQLIYRWFQSFIGRFRSVFLKQFYCLLISVSLLELNSNWPLLLWNLKSGTFFFADEFWAKFNSLTIFPAFVFLKTSLVYLKKYPERQSFLVQGPDVSLRGTAWISRSASTWRWVDSSIRTERENVFELVELLVDDTSRLNNA